MYMYIMHSHHILTIYEPIHTYIYIHTHTACMNHISTHISTYPVPVVSKDMRSRQAFP